MPAQECVIRFGSTNAPSRMMRTRVKRASRSPTAFLKSDIAASGFCVASSANENAGGDKEVRSVPATTPRTFDAAAATRSVDLRGADRSVDRDKDNLMVSRHCAIDHGVIVGRRDLVLVAGAAGSSHCTVERPRLLRRSPSACVSRFPFSFAAGAAEAFAGDWLSRNRRRQRAGRAGKCFVRWQRRALRRGLRLFLGLWPQIGVRPLEVDDVLANLLVRSGSGSASAACTCRTSPWRRRRLPASARAT